MGKEYTHKMKWISDKSEYDVKIHRDDTIDQFIDEFHELFEQCHTVWYQKYPLKNNEKIYIKSK